ncbi:MAG: protein kinase [Anaerolineales bacterium]|nr:protein kinase [Anaerolineales bacterium]
MQGTGKNSPPKILGNRYEILEALGSGGMAMVYRCKDLNLQRAVAVKVLRDTYVEDPRFQANFLQEARSAANLSHPNIVTVFDFGQESNRLYIVMEYVSGTDLKTLIRRQQTIPIERSVEIMVQIAKGVGYAHRAGLVHCDLKPQNILITPDGGAKITDFGISRALSTISPDEKVDVVWGSPQYFAPEQAAGGPPSPSSDVYSLGVILYEMITGQLLFEADDPQTLAELHLRAEPLPPKAINPDVPDNLNHIILKVLSKEPSTRYRTADQFARILQNFARQQKQPASLATSLESLEPGSESRTMAFKPRELFEVDWKAVGLGLLAFLAIGGLIPLWLWVCLLYPSCPLNPG